MGDATVRLATCRKTLTLARIMWGSLARVKVSGGWIEAVLVLQFEQLVWSCDKNSQVVGLGT